MEPVFWLRLLCANVRGASQLVSQPLFILEESLMHMISPAG